MTTRNRDYPGKQWDPTLGVVHLYSTRNQFPAALLDLVDERVRIEQHQATPSVADYMVTTGGLTANTERAAARRIATPVVLPEGGPWLAQKIAALVAPGNNVHIYVYNRQDL